MIGAFLVLPSYRLTCYAYGRERGRALSGGAHATALTGLECWSSHPVVDPLLNVLSAAAALPRRVGPDRASLAFQVRLWCRLAAAWPPYIWRRCRLIRTGERPQGERGGVPSKGCAQRMTIIRSGPAAVAVCPARERNGQQGRLRASVQPPGCF